MMLLSSIHLSLWTTKEFDPGFKGDMESKSLKLGVQQSKTPLIFFFTAGSPKNLPKN